MKKVTKQVYDGNIQSILDDLTKNETLENHLRARNMPEEFIEKCRYCSLDGIDDVTSHLDIQKKGVGVRWNGYKEKYEFAFYETDTCFLIPLVNEKKEIHALKTRWYEGDVRYTYVKGEATAPTYHVAHTSQSLETTDTIALTEGEIKADVFAYYSGIPTISIGGVTQWKSIIPVLEAAENAETFLLLFDTDVWNSPEKKREYNSAYGTTAPPAKKVIELWRYIHDTFPKVTIHVCVWPTEYGKGIDDAVLHFAQQGKKYDDYASLIIGETTYTSPSTVKSLEKTFAKIPPGWVRIAQGCTWLKESSGELFDDKGFREATHRKYSVAKLGKSPYLPRVDRCIYDPTLSPGIVEKQEKGETNLYYNAYTPSPLLPQQGDVSLFTDHMERLFTPTQLSIVMDWVSYSVQHPHHKMLYALILQGEPGTGKSFIGDMVKHCVGESNWGTITNADILSPFNGWIEHKCFIVVEEFMSDDKYKIETNLKRLITQSDIPLRKMYHDSRTYKQYANFLLFTNYKHPIVLKKGDRRYAVIYSDATKDEAWTQQLWEWSKKEETRAAIYHYLLSYIQSSTFNPYGIAPMTEEKRQLIQASMSDVETCMNNAIKEIVSLGIGLVTLPELKYYIETVNGLSSQSIQKMMRIMHNNGYTALPQIAFCKEVMRFFDITPDKKYKHNDITQDMLREIYGTLYTETDKKYVLYDLVQKKKKELY